MGFMDGPSRIAPSAATVALIGQTRGLVASARQYIPAQDQRLAELQDPASSQQGVVNVASNDVNQKFAGPQGTASSSSGAADLAPQLTRVRALSKVASAGDEAVTQQNVRDRISALDYGRGRRNASLREQAQISDNENVIAGGKRDASKIVDNATMNAVGSLVGAAARYGQGAYSSYQDSQLTPIVSDRGYMSEGNSGAPTAGEISNSTSGAGTFDSSWWQT